MKYFIFTSLLIALIVINSKISYYVGRQFVYYDFSDCIFSENVKTKRDLITCVFNLKEKQ